MIFLIVGNALIFAAWKWESRGGDTATLSVDAKNFRVVDDRVWRGAAPGEQTYRDLAANGATTVVDLRAEADVHVDTELLDDLGLDLVRIPMRDGQAPSHGRSRRFLAAVAGSDGPVYVHCGAGVGRTGTMVAAYLVEAGRANGMGAMLGNLSVGPSVARAARVRGIARRRRRRLASCPAGRRQPGARRAAPHVDAAERLTRSLLALVIGGG